MSEAKRWCIAHLLPHGGCDTPSALCTSCPPLAPTDPQATVDNDSPSDSTGPLSSSRLSPGPTTDPQQWAALPLSPADEEQKTGILSSLPYGSPSTRAWGQAWGHLVQSPAPGECIQIMEEMLLFGPFCLKKKKKKKKPLRRACMKRAKQMSVLIRLSRACLTETTRVFGQKMKRCNHAVRASIPTATEPAPGASRPPQRPRKHNPSAQSRERHTDRTRTSPPGVGCPPRTRETHFPAPRKGKPHLLSEPGDRPGR